MSAPAAQDHNSPSADIALGLTSAEAQERLAGNGANEIADVSQHPVRLALEQLWAPIPWMLEAAIVVSAALREYPEAAVVALLLVFNAALSLFQQSRAQTTLDALKTRLALHAQVKRDGAWITASAANLVADDIVKLTLGAVVPADVRVLTGSVLVDESMLTGESLPIEAGPGIATYTGALVRRGAAIALVTATGERTKFGASAKLIRSASVESTQQRTILGVVRNLVIFNGAVTVLLTGYALVSSLPRAEIVPLVLVAMLASIPVALPSMFTLAAAIGARALGACGVLPTRLSAVDEAAGIDVLCSDKTGTLTRNELAVMSVRPFGSWDAARVLAFAALASSEGEADPVDAAIRAAAARTPLAGPTLVAFIPFDPQLKRAEATVRDGGAALRVVKGAFSVVAGLARTEGGAARIVDALAAEGFRIIAVAAGPTGDLTLQGLIALSDPPRDDAAGPVAQLATLGVRTVMITGDAPATAGFVAHAVGIGGAMSTTSPLPPNFDAKTFAIFAGVLPEDKFAIVKALQDDGDIVGMCGDGANDAPALRQAQMGIAVSTATDIAKSAAGMVLTLPGLSGVVTAVTEGRRTFQRILTYTLRSLTSNGPIGRETIVAIERLPLPLSAWMRCGS